MLKNNNQKAVKLIAKRSMQSNRVRNIFAVIAVILTTLMLTSVFTIMISLGKNLNTAQLRMQGTCSSIFLNNPTDEQISKANGIKSVKAVGTYIDAGKAIIDTNKDNFINIKWLDETEFKDNLTPAISDIKGKYPTEENEIMLSLSALDVLNIKTPQVGMKIDLSVTSEKADSMNGNFILSGWYTDFVSSSDTAALVSKKYADTYGLTVEKDGIMSISCKSNKQDDVYNQLCKFELSSNQDVMTNYDVQSENGSNMLVIAAVIVLISLIIVLSGYLLIYNVMYISVTKDIRFYGMLKTIGTSPSQIRQIVKGQAFRFLIIGMPIGILLGTLISFSAAPLASKMFSANAYRESAMSSDITFNPFIYIGTIIFAILTVALSCRKPAKIASSISPVEALKYNGVKGGGNIKAKKSINGGKPYKMAFRNVFREKKRAILVFASLFMGTMAFLSVNTFIGSMKFENYVDVYLPNDYSIYTYNPDSGGNEDYNSSMNSFADKMKKIDDLEYVEVCRQANVNLQLDKDLYKPFLDNFAKITSNDNLNAILAQCESGEYDFSTNVISVSSRMIEMYNKKAHTKIDVDAFENGEIALVGELEFDGDGDSMLGKSISLTDSESGKSVDIKVGSISTDQNHYGINVGYGYYSDIAPSYILVSDKVIDMLTDAPTIAVIIADCKDNANVTAIDNEVLKLIENNRYVEAYDIKNQEMSGFKDSMTALSILTSSISIILILIGILNFVNVMLTGVYTRRRELAVLESVGMTKKQIFKMLMFEGFYYALITIASILTLGNGIMYLVAALAQQIADYAVFYYPFGIMAAICAFILLVCTVVPSIVYKTVSKESVTERLHDTE